jgi:hypothetical protein
MIYGETVAEVDEWVVANHRLLQNGDATKWLVLPGSGVAFPPGEWRFELAMERRRYASSDPADTLAVYRGEVVIEAAL